MTVVGLVVSSYGIAQLALRIPLGVWSDRLGRRKPFVVAGIAVAGAGALGLGLSPNVWFLFGARTLTGLAAATLVPIAVLFAGFFPHERATRAVGIVSFILGVSEMLATYGGGLIAERFGWQAAFYSGAILAMLGLVCMLGVEDKTVVAEKAFTLKSVGRIATVPLLLWVSLLALLGTFITFGINVGFANVYAASIGATKADLGTMTALMFATQAVANLAAAALVDRTGSRFMVVGGMALLGLANIAVLFIDTVPLMTLYQAVSGVGRGLTRPVLMGLSILAVPTSERATAMGVFQAVYAIGMTIGPTLAGVSADIFGLSSVFVLAAGVSLLGTVFALRSIPAK